jgi:hypothetical protein
MKTVFLTILCLFISAPVFAIFVRVPQPHLPRSEYPFVPLIEYKYGNQIFGSSLVIAPNGRVHHEERTCCAPRTDKVPEKKLTEAQLKQLVLLIADASDGQIAVTPCKGTMGEIYGSFKVSWEYNSALISSDELKPDMTCVSSRNTSEAALKLQEFVNRYNVHAPQAD